MMNAATATTAQILRHVEPELAVIIERQAAERASRTWDFDQDRHAMERAAVAPREGMGATILGWSDRDACTIIAVTKNGREVTVREDHAKLLNAAGSGADDALEFTPGGFCGHTSGRQRYAYATNPQGRVARFSRRVRKDRKGREHIVWVEVGSTRSGGRKLVIGERAHHHDFNF